MSKEAEEPEIVHTPLVVGGVYTRREAGNFREQRSLIICDERVNQRHVGIMHSYNYGKEKVQHGDTLNQFTLVGVTDVAALGELIGRLQARVEALEAQLAAEKAA